MLEQLKNKLRAIQPGEFQSDTQLDAQLTDAVVALLLKDGQVMAPRRPAHVKWRAIPGEPLCCHANVLAYSMTHTDAEAWYGFSLYQGWLWWVHSWATVRGGERSQASGVIFETEPWQPRIVPTAYFGVPWSSGVYRALGGGVPNLPDVLKEQQQQQQRRETPSRRKTPSQLERDEQQ